MDMCVIESLVHQLEKAKGQGSLHNLSFMFAHSFVRWSLVIRRTELLIVIRREIGNVSVKADYSIKP